jgi:phosphinothricin acetyltransferase
LSESIVGQPRLAVRAAELRDAAAIADIYNQGIRARIATFESEERSVEERERWLAAHDEHHPCLVAVDTEQDQVVGWVSADGYRSRACYRGIAEFSVYVHEDWRHHGVGYTLMEAFIPAAEEAGLWKLVSRIFPENMASRTLCRRVGFREVGIYEKHATLDGVWKDVVIVERLLQRNIEKPPPDW